MVLIGFSQVLNPAMAKVWYREQVHSRTLPFTYHLTRVSNYSTCWHGHRCINKLPLEGIELSTTAWTSEHTNKPANQLCSNCFYNYSLIILTLILGLIAEWSTIRTDNPLPAKTPYYQEKNRLYEIDEGGCFHVVVLTNADEQVHLNKILLKLVFQLCLSLKTCSYIDAKKLLVI